MESDIQKEILDYLNLYGLAVKIGQGCFKQGSRFIRMGGGFNQGKGWPDITWIYKGNIYLIEVKDRFGQLSPDQIKVRGEAEKHGIEIHILRSLEQAQKLKEDIDNARV